MEHIARHVPVDTDCETEDEDAVGSEMDDEDAEERNWPPELLRMIFCRLPFPSLQKLQGISRTWKELFLSALHSATLEGRLFQADVLSVSRRWPQFCPIFVTMEPYYHIWGFDHSTETWRQIYKPVRRSFSNPNRVGQTKQTVLFGQFSNTLMCLVQRVENPLYIYLKKPQLLEVMVLNVFTGDYKVLPPLMEAEVRGEQVLLATIHRFFPDLEQIYSGLRCPNDFVFNFAPESGAYKVYLLYESICREENGRLQEEQNEVDLRGILMFEYLSTTGAWKAILSMGQRNSEKYKISLNTGSTAYVDGALYTISLEPMRVWRYYLDDAMDTSEADHLYSDILFRLLVEIDSLDAWGIVEVSAMLMVAVVLDDVVYVFEVDKDTLQWTRVSARVIVKQERKRKREEATSTESEVRNEEERKKTRTEDSPSDSKEGEESSKEATSTDSDTAVEAEPSKIEDDKKLVRSRRPKIKCPHYQIVSDSSRIYFWPYYASGGEEVLVYDVIDDIWSSYGDLTVPRMRGESGLQLLAGCSRPGVDPFASV